MDWFLYDNGLRQERVKQTDILCGLAIAFNPILYSYLRMGSSVGKITLSFF